MAKPVAESPTAPYAIRLALIALLPLIALALYLDGQHYDPDLVDFGSNRSSLVPSPSLFPDSLAGLQRAGQVRHFDKDNLYEYVNGHAEYFIGAGFRGLAVGEYGDTDKGQPALVINLYDMDEPLNAFGVLVDESGDRESVDIGTMGFRSGQGLSFIYGPYYVQMSLFVADLSADAAGSDLAGRLAEQTKAPSLAFRFPDLGKVTYTRFVKDDYRGLGFLSDVLERGFERDGEEIQTFLIQGSKGEIGELVKAFETFFDEDEMPYRQIEHSGLMFFLIDDPYEGEWFFVPLQANLFGAYTSLDDELIAKIQSFAKNSDDER